MSYNPDMGKKRLIVDLDELEHRALVADARALDMTVSNFVRKALGLSLLKQGVKRAVPSAKVRAKKAKKPEKKA